MAIPRAQKSTSKTVKATKAKTQPQPARRLKVLVTGGAGFIGSHIVDALIAGGHTVTVIDNLTTGKKANLNPKAKFVKADICDLRRIKPYFKGIDYVFHLAARARIQPSIINPVPSFESNVMGTLNVLLAARDAKIKRVVYSASSSVYGDQDALPLQEDMRPRFKNPYAVTKYVGEELCRLFTNIYGLETVALRYFNVYGPRQLVEGAYATVIGIFIKQIRQGKQVTIVGDGNIQRDFTHVSDVVRANILAATSSNVGKGEVLNIGTGKNYSINQVASMILAYTKMKKAKTSFADPQPVIAQAISAKLDHFKKPKAQFVYIPPRPGETRKTLADNSKAKQLLAWQPTKFLEEGLIELI